MPEATKDAAILIATSYQALSRAVGSDDRTVITDCAVVIVFAGFYVEANMNHIIATLGKDAEVGSFSRSQHPGLWHKLAWFYNEYVASSKVGIATQVPNVDLERAFPGFQRIHDFRNKLAHGQIDTTVTNLTDAERLRQQAKIIVDRLFAFAKSKGCDIPRLETYSSSISREIPGASFDNLSSDVSS